MVTTHPIRGPVANTVVADGIFDGITYSKGAATMKQLFYLIEEENFSKALNAYFNKYEWSNATLIDFMNELEKQFKVKEINLDDWRKLWLETPSLNII
jgi:aminopeptidase N